AQRRGLTGRRRARQRHGREKRHSSRTPGRWTGKACLSKVHLTGCSRPGPVGRDDTRGTPLQITSAATRRLHARPRVVHRRPGTRTHLRSALAGMTVATTALAGALVASPAAAETTDHVIGGELEWGFRSNFRSYVGLQTAATPANGGAVPVGQRITLVDPAQFDLDGVPAVPGSTSDPNETLPYLLPAQGGRVVSGTEATIDTAGGIVYRFPSHYFEIT